MIFEVWAYIPDPSVPCVGGQLNALAEMQPTVLGAALAICFVPGAFKFFSFGSLLKLTRTLRFYDRFRRSDVRIVQVSVIPFLLVVCCECSAVHGVTICDHVATGTAFPHGGEHSVGSASNMMVISAAAHMNLTLAWKVSPPGDQITITSISAFFGCLI